MTGGVIYAWESFIPLTPVCIHISIRRNSVSKDGDFLKINCLGTVNCLLNIMQDMESLSLENKLLRIYDGIAVSDS